MSQAVLFVAYVTLQYFLSNFWVFMYPSLCVPLPIPFLSFACCVQYEELLHMEIERTAVKENTLAVTGRPLEPRDTQRSSRKWHKLSEHAHTHTHTRSLVEQMVHSLDGSEGCVVGFKQFGFMNNLWLGMFLLCGSDVMVRTVPFSLEPYCDPLFNFLKCTLQTVRYRIITLIVKT